MVNGDMPIWCTRIYGHLSVKDDLIFFAIEGKYRDGTSIQVTTISFQILSNSSYIYHNAIRRYAVYLLTAC
jgi:hypothetical protein